MEPHKRARSASPARSSGDGDGGSSGSGSGGSDEQLFLRKWTAACGESANAVQISPDRTAVAACFASGAIRVYDARSGALRATLAGHTRGVSAIAFSPSNSDILASGSDDLTVRLWSVGAQRCLRILKKHTYHLTAVVFNSKGSVLVSGAADETIVVWDLASGRSLKTLAAHSDPVSALALTPDDTLIVSSSYDGLMRLFDAETGQCLKTLVYNSASHGTATASTTDVVNFPISHVAVSPNGKYILSSSLDGKIRLWDYMSSKVVKTYGAGVSTRYSSGSAFVTCTRRPLVVSGSDASGAMFWDLQTKQAVLALEPGRTVLGVAAAAGGALLATCTLQGDVSVYEYRGEHEAH